MTALPRINVCLDLFFGHARTRAAPQHVDFWERGPENVIIKVYVEDIT